MAMQFVFQAAAASSAKIMHDLGITRNMDIDICICICQCPCYAAVMAA